MSYIVGMRADITCTFSDDITGHVADPTDVIVSVRDPGNTLTAYSFSHGDVTRVSTGVYRYSLNLSVAGTYKIRFEGNGVLQAAVERSITCNPSIVL